MASSSASGGELAELKQELKGLKEQKAAAFAGPRDLILLGELNKDLDQVQAASTALSCGELHFPVSASARHSSCAVCKGIQLVCHAQLWDLAHRDGS